MNTSISSRSVCPIFVHFCPVILNASPCHVETFTRELMTFTVISETPTDGCSASIGSMSVLSSSSFSSPSSRHPEGRTVSRTSNVARTASVIDLIQPPRGGTRHAVINLFRASARTVDGKGPVCGPAGGRCPHQGVEQSICGAHPVPRHPPGECDDARLRDHQADPRGGRGHPDP